ncbi:MAG: hypothetical protein J5I81_02310 [Nitrococcus mobilis]|nr:hypothetical protein [Nitrococcus mobilis]
MAKLIFEDPLNKLAIRSHDSFSTEMVELAASTVWGSGGSQYQIRDIETKLLHQAYLSRCRALVPPVLDVTSEDAHQRGLRSYRISITAPI